VANASVSAVEGPVPSVLSGEKARLLGHWGTTPGVANAYLEGTSTETYPHVTGDETGMHKLFGQFSPGLGSHAADLPQEMFDRRVAARAYTRRHGDDPPEVRDWTWQH